MKNRCVTFFLLCCMPVDASALARFDSPVNEMGAEAHDVSPLTGISVFMQEQPHRFSVRLESLPYLHLSVFPETAVEQSKTPLEKSSDMPKVMRAMVRKLDIDRRELTVEEVKTGKVFTLPYIAAEEERLHSMVKSLRPGQLVELDLRVE